MESNAPHQEEAIALLAFLRNDSKPALPMRAFTKEFDSRGLVEQLERLDKRRGTVEAHLRHSLLRLQADTLASTLREVHSQSMRQRNTGSQVDNLGTWPTAHLSQNPRESMAAGALSEHPQDSHERNSQVKTRKARKQDKFFEQATQQIMRTSKAFRGWRFDVGRAKLVYHTKQ